jgi:hypothetical protein
MKSNQRTQQVFGVGSTYNYTYDAIGQLTFGDSATASEDRRYVLRLFPERGQFLVLSTRNLQSWWTRWGRANTITLWAGNCGLKTARSPATR